MLNRNPLILCFADGGILSTEDTISALDQNFVPVVSLDMRLPTQQEQQEAAMAVRSYYFADRQITLNESINLASVSRNITHNLNRILTSCSMYDIVDAQ